MRGRSTIEWMRPLLFVLVGAALGAAVWFQRATIGSALAEMRSMSLAVVVALVALGVLERVTRAGILRRLLEGASFRQALTIHDVGTAATKGIPLGGPVATGLRWSIARDADLSTPRLASALVGYGVAATFVTWLLPFGVLLIELTQRSPTATDLVMIAVCALVLGASTLFWAVVLTSDRVTAFLIRHLRRLWTLAGRRIPAAVGHDPAAGLLEIRASLHGIARRPVRLLALTAVAHACGAVILLVALRGIGVGAELGTLEFARVFFVVTLLSSFVPVPGGIGVVEAGLSGALVAAGVEPTAALAGVLVYRLLTYVVPIVVGAILYLAWRADFRRRNRRDEVPVSPVPASPVPAHSVS
ncbi:MAG TPA: lysylphosphatidylglycerol synthase transmembrane domain-containing protein [Ilumatobacteraceae bacterium]|nr:lysylphosphatidylglycerol synthase transmembrane domain-containing protein [Ilumatobacteraceae bacterium]